MHAVTVPLNNDASMKPLNALMIALLLFVTSRPGYARGGAREIDLPDSLGSPGATAEFIADGRVLLYFDGKGITSWDVAAQKPLSIIPADHWSFVVSADGTLVAGNRDDFSAVALYDAATGRQLHELQAPPSEARGPTPPHVPPLLPG